MKPDTTVNETKLLPITTLTEYSHPCSYLPGREARTEFVFAGRVRAAMYGRLLARGFRRSGHMIYRPNCAGCRECQPIRALTESFRPDRSMRRNWRTNQDLVARIAQPRLSAEKRDLYARYLSVRHDKESSEGLDDFLYATPVDSLEIEFRLNGTLVGVAIADVVPTGLSAVYTYFEPQLASRGLGTFAVLWQINFCRERRRPHLYLGYFVRDCRKMNYKNRFVPHEILGPDGQWHRPVLVAANAVETE